MALEPHRVIHAGAGTVDDETLACWATLYCFDNFCGQEPAVAQSEYLVLLAIWKHYCFRDWAGKTLLECGVLVCGLLGDNKSQQSKDEHEQAK